ncbi:diguanylate cyclase domain-containing protein [Paenibacillus silvisoli]|uniref:diguanylate cyclase domain-containing protein n=1 Tax=Paenibacillus silvisoli TaxID=3110539 RepID=UPI0028042B00|nr:diguanylate cyclase [Paenibacillus silvisoli]
MSQPQVPNIKVDNLLTLQASRSQRRFALVIGAMIALISLVSVPFARVQLSELQAYQPAILSTVICFELITAYVLYSQFQISRSPSVLFLFAGYLYSGAMSIMYLLTFPGLIVPGGMFHAGLQTAPWLYVLWHLGFPVSIGLYMLVETKYKSVQLSIGRAKHVSILTVAAVIAIVGAFAFVTTSYQEWLPILLVKGQLTPLFIYGAGLFTVIVSLVTWVGFRMTRGSTVMTSWLCIALLASLLDVVVILCGGGRFSLGWYVAKWNTFVCANIVLGGMIYEFTKMYLSMTELYRKNSEQNKIIERMLESSREAIVMCDVDGSVIFANRRFEQMFERPLINGQQLADYCMGMKASYGTLGDRIKAYLEQQKATFRERVTLMTSKWEVRHYECYVNPIADEESGMLHGYLFAFGDRTDEERMANYDELTGLQNRRFLGERLLDAMERAKDKTGLFSVFFMDLDGFKKVNDTLGHEMGDRLLQEVASLLRICVEDRGMCARWAGDEFIVLLENIESNEQLTEIADRIIQAIQEMREIDGIEVSVTASIGVAIYPQDGMEGKMLLHHADQAMYEAKMKGKNTCCFYNALAAVE